MSRKRPSDEVRSRRSQDVDASEDSTEAGYTRRQRFELDALRIQERGKLIALAIRLGVTAFIVYCVGDSLKVLAGKTTVAQIIVKLLSNQGFSSVVAWMFGVGGIGVGLLERRLRHRDTKQLAERLKQYEASIDPERRSSKLDSQGDYR